VAAAALLTVIAFTLQITVGVAVGLLSVPTDVDVTSPGMTLVLVVLGQFVFFLVAYLYVRKRDIRIPLSVPDKGALGVTALGAAAAFLLAMIALTIMEGAGIAPETDYAETSIPFIIGFALISTFIVAPVEEYLFRGVIQGRLRKSMGAPAAIAVASLLFGSVHILNYAGPLAGVLAATLLIVMVGAILGALYEYTGNLWAPVIAHAAYNLAIIAASLAAL